VSHCLELDVGSKRVTAKQHAHSITARLHRSLVNACRRVRVSGIQISGRSIMQRDRQSKLIRLQSVDFLGCSKVGEFHTQYHTNSPCRLCHPTVVGNLPLSFELLGGGATAAAATDGGSNSKMFSGLRSVCNLASARSRDRWTCRE
jgi:hypothetical protein